MNVVYDEFNASIWWPLSCSRMRCREQLNMPQRGSGHLVSVMTHRSLRRRCIESNGRLRLYAPSGHHLIFWSRSDTMRRTSAEASPALPIRSAVRISKADFEMCEGLCWVSEPDADLRRSRPMKLSISIMCCTPRLRIIRVC